MRRCGGAEVRRCGGAELRRCGTAEAPLSTRALNVRPEPKPSRLTDDFVALEDVVVVHGRARQLGFDPCRGRTDVGRTLAGRAAGLGGARDREAVGRDVVAGRRGGAELEGGRAGRGRALRGVIGSAPIVVRHLRRAEFARIVPGAVRAECERAAGGGNRNGLGVW